VETVRPTPGNSVTARRPALLVLLFVALVAVPVWAQPPAGSPPASRDPRLSEAVPSSDAAVLTYANRPITRLRARVLANLPADRARAATSILDQLVENNIAGPVTAREVAGVRIIRVADRDVLTLVEADVEDLEGQTLEQKAAEAAAALRLALDEAVELQTPGRLLRAALAVAGATLLFAAASLLVSRLRRRFHRAVVAQTPQLLDRVVPGGGTREPALILSRFVGAVVTVGGFVVTALLVYWWLTFSLRQFPYTRPWGETLRAQVLRLLGNATADTVAAVPGLIVVLIIVSVTRLLVQVSNGFFANIERGRSQVAWAPPETAAATRRLVAILLWLFAVVVSYPYVPGSGSDAFKGVSVLVGLVLSLGSSGVVNQLMSGLTLTYARALKPGDFVRLGDAEGLVTSLNMLSVKLRTFQGEEVTVPNGVVVGLITINYTRLAASEASYLAVTVTIGYDTPWRQVRALLLMAAERTEGIRQDPPPLVVKDALEDFYVRYRLLVGLVDPAARIVARDRLHASILDAFNEFGVQIMSPNYEADPDGLKVVPTDQWFAPPAAPSAPRRS
jgi:small-conductance mechanosensitive channel